MAKNYWNGIRKYANDKLDTAHLFRLKPSSIYALSIYRS